LEDRKENKTIARILSLNGRPLGVVSDALLALVMPAASGVSDFHRLIMPAFKANRFHRLPSNI